MRTPGAVSALSKYGFTEADLRAGVERLNVVTQVRLRPEPLTPEPKLIASLDAFEGEWFSVAQAALKHAHPDVAEWLFAGLPASRGVDVTVAVKTFVERVDAPESGASGLGEQAIAARALRAGMEWSTIARVAIKERYILRAPGFRRNQRADEAESDGESEGGDESEGAASTPAQPVLALPARASSPEDMRRSTPA